MSSFNDDSLRKKLDDLNMSQQAIQTLSLWLIHHKKHANPIVETWYKELIKAPDKKKLVFMYLANDVIQNSKRKGQEYNKEFALILPKAFKHLASQSLDEKSKQGIKRLLDVWDERSVFDDHIIKEFKKRANPKSSSEKRSSEQHVKSSKKIKMHIEADEFANAYEETPIENLALPSQHSESTVAEDPPLQPEEIINVLQDLESAASADADVRNKIANLPPNVSDSHSLDKLDDQKAAKAFEKQVEEAMEMLEKYNKRLQDEMETRKNVAKLLRNFISHQKDLLSQSEDTMEEHKQMLTTVQKVRKDLKVHLQNLPDISRLPNIGGNLAPLPSAGDLFT